MPSRGLPRSPTRLAVLCSGAGTNLQAILHAIQRRRLTRTRVAVVVSDRPGAFALTRARRAGIPTVVLDRARCPSRRAFETALLRALAQARTEVVVLAGFMRILSPRVVRRYRWRILNLHPALLPAFPGAHAIAEALAHGVKVTGVTVHLVDHGVDTGPIILQEAVVIRPGERQPSLERRMHRVEHRLYPRAIQLLVDRRLRLSGRRVVGQ